MDKIFIDANIFLELLLDNERADLCQNFLANVKNAATSDFILYTCILHTHRKFRDGKKIKDAIVFFNSLDLEIIRPSIDELNEAADVMKQEKLDFDDSLVVAVMKSNGIKELASFDAHFKKIKDIQINDLSSFAKTDKDDAA